MKRKLIKQGAGGLTICLPKKWVESNHLQAGAELEIQEENNSLLLSGQAAPVLKQQEISLETSNPELVSRIITNVYKRGIDELKLSFKKELPLSSINDIVATLTIGYEVTEVKNNSCLIKSFTAEQPENIPISVRKCFFLIKEMGELLQKDIAQKKFSNYAQTDSLHQNVRRLTNYAIRVVVKNSRDATLIQQNTIIFTELFLFSIKLKYIYYHAAREKKIQPTTQKILDHLLQLFAVFYDAYYLKKIELIEQMLLLKTELVRELDLAIDKGNGKILLQVSMALRCIHDSVGPLIGIIQI